ncbi:putative short-chain dehydrogenase [Phialemonium atrogriseum]|uniref:Short-chain dehydrogenase n=1 Tax=Phialemonium atrogriseum TaxID=1093897 RepID=A0AAJ0BW86_9PEZI|nr:putative short-chain dehydrogenase [Phialemonium atrogriseum]KAK1764254.1 putative short-chain dehydrogenase [Phialemonium atrogriseum]
MSSHLSVATDVTKVIHRTEYATISPSRPELSQAGKTVLVTGGSAGIGFAIAQAFVRAAAATVIIVGRRRDVLDKARAELEAQAGQQQTAIIAENVDVVDRAGVKALWEGLAARGVVVDVLVLNSAKFTEAGPLLELGVDEVWSQFEANVRGPLDFAERFYKQKGDSTKFLVNVSTQAINLFYDSQLPVAAERPAYSLTKNAGTLTAQLIANGASPDKLQVVSYHPGVIYSNAWKLAGAPADALPFDDATLPGAFAVWAASKEARFLHGRFVWASWDVNELATGEIRKRIDEDENYLRIGVVGLKGSFKA